MTESHAHLYHVSEETEISLFSPRPVRANHPAGADRPVVWAITAGRLQNYFLPRDCPRVTFYPCGRTSAADRATYFSMTAARAVVAIENNWLDVVRTTRLYVYELPSDTFREIDPEAGYWVSEQAVEPLSWFVVDDLLTGLANRNVELRLTPDLWPLHQTVLASTLCFSFIRMRNAKPREV